MIASSIGRCGLASRPPVFVAGGRVGSTRRHCSSVSRTKRFIAEVRTQFASFEQPHFLQARYADGGSAVSAVPVPVPVPVPALLPEIRAGLFEDTPLVHPARVARQRQLLQGEGLRDEARQNDAAKELLHSGVLRPTLLSIRPVRGGSEPGRLD